MSHEVELRPGEKLIARTRPAIRSFWVFMAGVLLVGVGPLIKEDAPIRPITGVVFGIVFLLIILRRWSEVYTLTSLRLMIRGGLIMRDTISVNLADIESVSANQGVNLRLVGLGHIMINSRAPDQGSITMYGQPHPYDLKERIENLAAQARSMPAENQDRPVVDDQGWGEDESPGSHSGRADR